MITFSNKHRSEQEEIMDSKDFRGEEMKKLLDDLKTVNKWLGGNKITIDGIQKLLQNHSKSDKVRILDIGCGDGELLRKCADFGQQNNYNFEFIGIDFNANILKYAKKRSENYPNIKFQKVDVFLEENLIPNCDIAVCTLFLHHFNTEEIENLLKKIIQKVNVGIVINDLHRSKQAFNLFKIVSAVFLKTVTASHDGLVSIAKGFKKDELKKISKQIPNQKSEIQWRWAYRYQWMLKKNL
ncbi:MAG: methyltransferase [Aequorivita sp.]|nr:MAG: methyltransferase [Aequorivita sp.]